MQITTYTQLTNTRSTLETLLSLANSDAKFKKVLKDSSLSADVAAKLEASDIQSRKKIIEGELVLLNRLKIVEITLGFKPKKTTLEKIYEAINKKNHVIDFIIDKSILGGVIINHEGKYKDLSLQKKIEKYSEISNK